MFLKIRCATVLMEKELIGAMTSIRSVRLDEENRCYGAWWRWKDKFCRVDDEIKGSAYLYARDQLKCYLTIDTQINF